MQRPIRIGPIIVGSILSTIGLFVAIRELLSLAIKKQEADYLAFAINLILLALPFLIVGIILLLRGFSRKNQARKHPIKAKQELTYSAQCTSCGNLVSSTISQFRQHRNFPEGFVYCPFCKKPISANLFGLNDNTSSFSSAPTNGLNTNADSLQSENAKSGDLKNQHPTIVTVETKKDDKQIEYEFSIPNGSTLSSKGKYNTGISLITENGTVVGTVKSKGASRETFSGRYDAMASIVIQNGPAYSPTLSFNNQMLCSTGAIGWGLSFVGDFSLWREHKSRRRHLDRPSLDLFKWVFSVQGKEVAIMTLNQIELLDDRYYYVCSTYYVFLVKAYASCLTTAKHHNLLVKLGLTMS